MKGIDISQWQGDINLAPYQNGFVIVRGGFWTSVDPWAERNIQKCEELSIPWGLYWYSYALNEEQAVEEAKACLKFLAGRKPRLGVWFDMEDADGYKAKNGFPSDETITAMCKAFCAAMAETGNKTGVYASLSWFDTHIGETGYDRWIAAWGANDGVNYPDLSGQCVMQQYRGSPLDLDVLYVPLSYFDGAEGPAPAQPEDVMVNATEMAREVIAARWGNGEERKQKLGAWFYDLVQGEVNRMLGV